MILYDYSVPYDLDPGATFYAVGMPTWLEGMLGRAADEIPRHWVAVTTVEEPHCAPQRDDALTTRDVTIHGGSHEPTRGPDAASISILAMPLVPA